MNPFLAILAPKASAPVATNATNAPAANSLGAFLALLGGALTQSVPTLVPPAPAEGPGSTNAANTVPPLDHPASGHAPSGHALAVLEA
ncbi:MAG: hypothetical protein ACREER_07205, partial [Alphaproteobacteria bacterium]